VDPRLTGLLARLERRTGATPVAVGVLALAVVVTVVGQRLGSRSVLLLGYGALAVLGLSRVLARRRLSVEAVRSALPTRVRVDQAVDVEITVTAKRRLAAVVLEEELPDALGARVRVPVPVLPGGDEVRHGYRFTARRRGVWSVGPLVAEWSDPFGLTRKRVVIAPAETVVVHPDVEQVRDRVTSREWEDPPVRPPQSKPWPSGFEFYGMRDYVPGDDPRRIIWSATARTLDDEGNGRYLVRESEQGITDRVTLLLDTDARTHAEGTPSETFERAVQAVASVGVQHLADGLSVTLEANGARLAAGLRGSRNRIPLLDALAAVERERVPFTAALERLFLEPRRHTHVVLVTPDLDVDAARRARLLLERGTSVLVVLVMSEDTDPRSVHRAGALGCGVVEVQPRTALGPAFARAIAVSRS
jgi:uncharacterized protein (DUF58 family)